ncbi:ABC transporter ATP-binding protein [Phaeocystidibacter marisrubri]|uniref:ATP-binding cassette domain-containing protein n=1 Tax=Phaeocystidibacter marisrubri TaxID=1577780 RepID=A0A6L3ZET2_9FLAO|nr:ATP-binding cassette domain-containing protein [Phaeocystidibacter marisrubri]KAB2815937.1 ATP-binding cassette domain-containing protein [Phaeocystidibacter marisrubri]GGH66483.1 phosphonate ABC transporter ATP-binding protein [Phaeocystidibacter marisrubri]
MIEVNGLKKGFNGTEVLKGIDVVFEPGKTNLIIGRSGSGKTVFLKSVLGLYDIDAGSIRYDGRDVAELSKDERKLLRQEIGMVFQGGALFDSQTVLENVMFPLNFFAEMSDSEKKDRADFCLSRVQLENAHQRFPAEISGGMQKRVAIARAIAMNPKYLFCDEPNSGLDPETAIVIDNLIQEITEEYNITTVVNTHDMNSVLEIGDHIILLKEGYKVWEGNKDEILHSDERDVLDFVFTSELFKKVRAAQVK